MKFVGHHQNHGPTSNREGRDLECYCVPEQQCPTSSVMNAFGLANNHVNQNFISQNSNQQLNSINNVNNGFGNLQGRPSREQLPDAPIKDYSNLINPRILPKDIVAADSNEKEDGEDHDTLDLSEEASFENNRARYADHPLLQ